MVALVIVLLVFAYFYYKRRAMTNSDPIDDEPDNRLLNNETGDPTRYIPVRTGQKVNGQQRVFMTNKGLRLYDTNTDGLPIPSD